LQVCPLNADSEFLPINDELSIPLAELQFRFSRSSGPGGQHVQKSSTRVELYFDVLGSPSLSEEQRARILSRLAGHIDSVGLLHLVAQSERSQLRNRQEVVARFQELLRVALRRRRRRLATHPSAASRELRLRHKRERGQAKRLRGKVADGE
jgi:ribosome-associated protein